MQTQYSTRAAHALAACSLSALCLAVGACGNGATPAESVAQQAMPGGAGSGAPAADRGAAGSLSAAAGGGGRTAPAAAGVTAVAGGSAAAGNTAAAASGAAAAGSPAGSPATAGTGGAAPAAGSSGGGGGGAPSQAAPAPGDLYVAPAGTDSASGSMSEPTSLSAAIGRIAAGHSIWLRGGTYELKAQLTIERASSGQEGQRKILAALPGEQPILDFSGEPYAADSNPRGLQINADYWHIRGLTVRKAADNGIYVAGSHNIVERCITHGNRDTGLQIGRAGSSVTRDEWPSDNLILNCESYDNYDAPPGSGENADGFAAKLTVGDGNVFRGCVSHHNIDDGWDLYTKTDTGAIGAVTIDQCVAHDNGRLTDGTSNASGDRNGFKLGGEKIAVPHVVTRSVAYDNGKNGFTWNSNPGAIRLSNTLAFDNADGNYRFGDNDTPTQAVFTNNVSLWTQSAAKSDKAVGEDASGSNCFYSSSGTAGSKSAKGLSCSTADFAQDLSKIELKRGMDGSLDWSVFGLAAGSDLINAGVVPTGALPFPASDYRGAPDLGPVEQAQ